MKIPIYISSISSISALGKTESEILNNYRSADHLIKTKEFSNTSEFICELNSNLNSEIESLRSSNSNYKKLDRSVLLSILVSREAIAKAYWKEDTDFGINIGSSRGATELFEKFHAEFVTNKRLSSLTSPSTTLGNISSWVAQDLNTIGPEISHSITCSTSLHSVLNGIAWLNSGMCNRFLVGGSEAPLTEFTVEQMKALRIYASNYDDYPCRASELSKTQNTMVLGEASVSMCLEKSQSGNTLAKITGIGFATELLENSTSISTDAKCFQKSMKQALGNNSLDSIDIIVTHTPGTIKGDKAELKAIDAIFGKDKPALNNNKWKIGHTLGASGLMSVEMAVLMLKHQEFFPVPFLQTKKPKKIQRIMVNSVGFGGNAVSLVLELD